MRWSALAAFSLVALTEAVAAGEFTSVYTSINFDKDRKIVAESEEGASITLRCRGYKGIAINYAEGDLRAAVTFGDQPPGYDAPWQSFGPWNRINTTVEWRLENSKPIAAILRWFSDNIDPETGAADPKRAGNILVISKLASRDGSPAA